MTDQRSSKGSSSYQKIYRTVRLVPRGAVATYGQIAERAGLGGHARQVGYALHSLAENSDVPWQRVINAQGEISIRSEPGYGWVQRRLLEKEGIEFDQRGRVLLDKYRWKPGRRMKKVKGKAVGKPKARGAGPKTKSRATTTATKPVGYSGTPLVKKLGIKEGNRAYFKSPPEGFDEILGPLPIGVKLLSRPAAKLDFILQFSDTSRGLERDFKTLARKLQPAGMIWVAWPKQSSGHDTDLNSNIVRKHGLDCGWVDTKVCAIDETWSGLRFVRRLKDR